jgi:hypothetical protein
MKIIVRTFAGFEEILAKEIFQITNLKQQPHIRLQRNPLITRQSQNLIIVHNRVQTLNPHRINITIQYNPLRAICLNIRLISHDVGEQAVLPLTSYSDTSTLQLVSGRTACSPTS